MPPIWCVPNDRKEMETLELLKGEMKPTGTYEFADPASLRDRSKARLIGSADRHDRKGQNCGEGVQMKTARRF